MPDVLTVVTMTITGFLTERKRGWRDPAMLRRRLSLAAFAVGALSGGLLIVNVGASAVLLIGRGILVAVTIGADRVSQTPAGLAAPRSA